MHDEPIPDWKLPAGVDRGLWDYMRSGEMVAGYDAQMAESPLARADVEFCERVFAVPGRLLDMGCGTGRLCRHFAAKGLECVGVDLSEEMLERAKARPLPRAGLGSVSYLMGNLTELHDLGEEFDYAACLFSTLGMVRGAEHRAKVIANAFRALRPGGRFVLHVHNRWFRGLGKNWRKRDITMQQAYAGAPLTLHHFSLGEVTGLLKGAGFVVDEVKAVDVAGNPAKWPRMLRAYGYLIAASKLTEGSRPR
ncbi:MAG: class I SAM-dependent methyltransferase [Gemmataceae bacterium]